VASPTIRARRRWRALVELVEDRARRLAQELGLEGEPGRRIEFDGGGRPSGHAIPCGAYGSR
jgi:hypothetical protein